MILVVDDDKAICLSLKLVLERNGYEVVFAEMPQGAIQVVRNTPAIELVLMDMNFSGETYRTSSTDGEEGLTLLKQVKVFRPDVPVILMTAWGSIDLAVRGMRAGAFDFITKPWDNGVLLERIKTAKSLSVSPAPSPEKEGGIVGTSLSGILATVSRVAPTNAPVLITGESGTGKELIAEAIHRQSRRAGKPFVKVNLGGISTSLFESEMFGHKKGAFTDAKSDRIGRFEMAEGGTIFLDEIGELSLASQVSCCESCKTRRTKCLVIARRVALMSAWSAPQMPTSNKWWRSTLSAKTCSIASISSTYTCRPCVSALKTFHCL